VGPPLRHPGTKIAWASNANPNLESATQESISIFAEAYAKCMWLEWTKIEDVRFGCAFKFEFLTLISDLLRL